MTFEEWAESKGVTNAFVYFDTVKAAWDAATAEVKKDHYRIGEEVEIDILSKVRGCIYAIGTDNFSVRTDCPSDVRRIPEWQPKDGDAVLAKSQIGYAFYAVSAGRGRIYHPAGVTVAWDIKPWQSNCQGLPWDQV